MTEPTYDDIEFRDTRPWRILIAEDSAVQAHALAEIIRRSGFPSEIVEAASGDAALAILELEDIDLAFIDITMPGLTGDEVVRRAAAQQRMPFYAVTSAKTDEQTIQSMKSLSAYDYIKKPFQDYDIIHVLQILRRAREPQKILIIDDSSTARHLVSRVLSRSIFNIAILEAGDGITGFEIIAAENPNVVFLDMNMPGVTGEQTYRLIKAHGGDTIVVFMSADADCLANVSGKGKGPVLKKPFWPRDVDAVMHQIYGIPLPYNH